MAEEWGPWFRNSGGYCDGNLLHTVGVFQLIMGRRDGWWSPSNCYTVTFGQPFFDGFIWRYPTEESIWNLRVHDPFNAIVKFYRFRRPDALRRLIDLAADPERGMPPRFPVEKLA